MAPSVSICVPTYNGEPYLGECLDSVLAQTFGDLEILIVDDGSSDGTVALAERYARRDARVRVERNAQNLGLVGNWNRCAALARGEWIKFAFQDDLLAPTCVERLVAAARGAGRPMASCARTFLFAPETPGELRDQYLGLRDLIAGLLPADVTPEQFSALTVDYFALNLLGEPTVVLLHRDVFERFGPFNAHMTQYVDAEYWARVGTALGSAHVHDDLATFRVHPASTTARNNGPRLARTKLDYLVLRHEYAFGPAYANLRAVARRTRPERDLAREFWDAAHQMLVVEGVAKAAVAGDARTRAEASAVYAAYPRLRYAKQHGLRMAVSEFLARHDSAARTYRFVKHALTSGRGREAARPR